MPNWSQPKGKQRTSICDSTARLNIWHGAVRSSKTVAANLRWLRYVAQAIKSDVPGDLLMFGKTERTLKRNILDPIAEFLGTGTFSYNRGEGEISIWGRKIHIVGANDERAEGKIRGGTYLGAYGDELTLIPESFFKMLLSRLSLPGAMLFGTTNPDGPYHWLRAQYLEAEGLNLRQFHFTLEDNPHLPVEYIEQLKKEYSGLWYKRFILGLWVQAAGAIYDMWGDENVTQLQAPESAAYVVDIDYGTANPCTFSLKRVWRDGEVMRVHTEREYWHDGRESGRQKTDAEYVDDLVQFVQGVPGKPPVYVDPSALSFIVAGKKRGLRMTEAVNDVLDGVRFVGSMVAARTYTVDPSCTHTIRNYQSYVWDEKAQARGEDRPLKEHDHACDRDRYGIYTHLGGQRQTKGGVQVTL